MSCNSCCKAFSLIRKEKGCPGCGFSNCSKCLNYKVFLLKFNAEVKVCGKCKNAASSTNKVIDPPATYFKFGKTDSLEKKNMNKAEDKIEEEIKRRLLKLKEEKLSSLPCSDKDIAERLNKLRDIPSTSQAELEQRLANVKGVPVEVIQSQPVLPTPDLRTEEEQANDLLKQYISKASIDKKYEDEFDSKISDIERKLQKLKGSTPESGQQININSNYGESEDDIIRKIIEQANSESDNEVTNPTKYDELPFCEICNEDAVMRCLGCKYLFCKQCFMEHKDDDDGCDKYESYTAPKHCN